MCLLKFTTLFEQKSHQLLRPKKRVGVSLVRYLFTLIDAMRVAQMILIRVLVLEDLAAHVAFNLIV